jgi:hypothetical protein
MVMEPPFTEGVSAQDSQQNIQTHDRRNKMKVDKQGWEENIQACDRVSNRKLEKTASENSFITILAIKLKACNR